MKTDKIFCPKGCPNVGLSPQGLCCTIKVEWDIIIRKDLDSIKIMFTDDTGKHNHFIASTVHQMCENVPVSVDEVIEMYKGEK